MTTPFGSKAYPQDPTMPSAAPQGYVTPPTIASPTSEAPLTDAEIAARRNNFYELIIRQVVLALTGFVTADPATGQLQAWAEDLLTNVESVISYFIQNVVIDTGVQIGNVINTIFNSFFGTITTETTALVDAASAMFNQWSQTLQNTHAIQELQATALAGTVSGHTVSVNFSNYADGPLPGIFTVTYSGAGTSTLVVQNSLSQWNLINDADRSAVVRYNVAPTDTDFQIVRGAMAEAPQEGGARIWACARMDSTGANYVWARAYSVGWLQWHADIGCTVAGVDTVWVPNIPLTWSMDIYLKAGVGATARQYELWSGNVLVYTHTEVGTTSQLGASFRYWGAKTEMKQTGLGASSPGKIAGTSITDNAPATVLGTHAHMYRTGTGTANLAGASVWTFLPASFFGVTLRTSTDLTVDLTNGRFTVTKSGSYTINARIRLNSSVIALVYMGLLKNGTLDQVSDFWWPGDTSGESIGGHFTTYLQAGDFVELATFNTGATVGVLTGEATGTQTYFNITGVGGLT